MSGGIWVGCLGLLMVAVGACDRNGNREEAPIVASNVLASNELSEASGGTSGGGEPVCLGIGKPCTGAPPCCPGLACVGTCMKNPSDKNLKRDFAEVDRKAILERVASLPISTWSYKDEPNRPRHIGPMAQDFKQTFDVGADDKTIFQIDADGIAFAAIQALDAEVKRLTKENSDLRHEVKIIRATISKERR